MPVYMMVCILSRRIQFRVECSRFKVPLSDLPLPVLAFAQAVNHVAPQPKRRQFILVLQRRSYRLCSRLHLASLSRPLMPNRLLVILLLEDKGMTMIL